MADLPLTAAVTETLRHLGLSDVDHAAGQLALAYAREIDSGGDMTKIGPKLLTALEALGATPRARRAITGKGKPDEQDPLDELEQRRRRRTG